MIAYWFSVMSLLEPHGELFCRLPPAAAYSSSASLGRKPPSQMQNAYASYHVTQLIGRFSLLAADAVHVAGKTGYVPGAHTRFRPRLTFVGSTYVVLFHVASHPVSYITAPPSSSSVALFKSPFPPFKCVCLPDPSVG
jgi:hypothetical protein